MYLIIPTYHNGAPRMRDFPDHVAFLDGQQPFRRGIRIYRCET